MEPNIINLESPYLQMLVGSTKIANRYEIMVHSQWALEFNTLDAPYYTNTINTAKSMSLYPYQGCIIGVQTLLYPIPPIGL